MALIKCPDCNKDISDLAEICLQCGRPIRNSVVSTKIKTSGSDLSLFSESETIALRKKIIENESHGIPKKPVQPKSTAHNARRDELIANIKLAILGIMTVFVILLIKKLLRS